jgi:hypothetical protein
MQQSVAHEGFVNVAWLWIADAESAVWPVAIGSRNDLSMKRNRVVHEVQRKLLHVDPLPLSSDELLPCLNEIFGACDMVERER